MISKRAKEIAKEIDKRDQKRTDELCEQRTVTINKVHFAHKYKICPTCINKLSYPFFRNMIAMHIISTTLKCKKCKILYKRTPTFDGYFYCKLKKLK